MPPHHGPRAVDWQRRINVEPRAHIKRLFVFKNLSFNNHCRTYNSHSSPINVPAAIYTAPRSLTRARSCLNFLGDKSTNDSRPLVAYTSNMIIFKVN